MNLFIVVMHSINKIIIELLNDVQSCDNVTKLLMVCDSNLKFNCSEARGFGVRFNYQTYLNKFAKIGWINSYFHHCLIYLNQIQFEKLQNKPEHHSSAGYG